VARQVSAVLSVLAMVAVIVGVDILFLRHHVVARLISNVAIVLVFAVGYLLLLRRPQD
jgi:hypothetical protein